MLCLYREYYGHSGRLTEIRTPYYDWINGYLPDISELVCEGLRPLLTVSNDYAAFITEPVERPNDEKHNQRELEDRYIADDIQDRNAAPRSVDRVKCRVCVGIAQATKPQEVDEHQASVDECCYIDG